VPRASEIPRLSPGCWSIRNGSTVASARRQWRYFAKVLAGEAEPHPNGHGGRQSIPICPGSVISARESTVVNVKDLI